MSLLAQQLEQRYRLTFEHAHIGIALADPQGFFVRVNKRYSDILGYDASELLGRHFSSVSHPDDVAMTRDKYESLIDGRTKFISYERRYIRKDGAIVWAYVTLSAATDEEGKVVGIIGVVEDITEQRAAAEQIRFQSTLLSSVKQAVIATDMEGRITYWSPYAEQLYEWNAADVVGRKLLDTISSDTSGDLTVAILERVSRGESWTGEFDVRNRSGHAFTVLVSSSPIRDTSGKQIGVVSVSQDLTDLKWRETEMQRRASQQAALAHIGQIALGNASIGFLLAQAADIVREVLAVAYCEIYKRTGERLLIVAGASVDGTKGDIDKDDGAHNQAAYTMEAGTPVVCNYLATESRFKPSSRMLNRGVISSATVPIDGGVEGPWGVLGAYSRAAHDFAQSEVNFLRALAMTLGQAIERRRAEVELQVRAIQQSAIAELGRRTATRVDQATIDRACELVMDGLSVEFSTFLEPVEGGQSMRVRAGIHWLPDGATDLNIDNSQAGFTARNRLPVIVRDYAQENRFENSQFTSYGVRAGLTVPVATEHHTFGVLAAGTRLPKEFTAGDIQFMQSIATMLAEALDRDAAQSALIESEARFRGVIEGASDIIFTVDPLGRVTSINPRFEAVTGWPVEQWVGKSFEPLVHPDDREAMVAAFTSLMTGGGTLRVETRMIGKDGRVILVEASSSAKTVEGRPVEIIGFARDITEERRLAEERRKLEVKLDQSSRLSSLGRLAATVAHEFNNVLMGIAPFAEILRREVTAGRGVTAVEQIANAVKRGKRITEDILRFTQPAQPVLSVVDTARWLNALVLEARTIVGAKHAVESSLGPGDLRIRADANQLHQSFTNLILNARDAMPDGGRITIRARREPADATFAFGAVEKPESFVHFEVEDTGSGIAPATLQQIFEPLFTTKRNGTGLGLSVTRNVISRHGGEIFVTSTPGVGTTFHLFIPLADPQAAVDVVAQPERPTATRGLKRVLLVEDDITVAEGLTALLRGEGVEVSVVHTGGEVLPALEKSTPDAVILDIGLPDIEGTVVFELIAARFPDLPVVFSSGHADQKKVAAYLGDHVAFLNKPYDYDALFTTLRKVTTVTG